jgi:hypothetical protein
MDVSSDQHALSPQFLGLGSYGIVFSLHASIVVKVKRGLSGALEEFINEQQSISRLGRVNPYMLPYFHSDPNATFMLRG